MIKLLQILYKNKSLLWRCNCFCSDLCKEIVLCVIKKLTSLPVSKQQRINLFNWSHRIHMGLLVPLSEEALAPESDQLFPNNFEQSQKITYCNLPSSVHSCCFDVLRSFSGKFFLWQKSGWSSRFYYEASKGPYSECLSIQMWGELSGLQTRKIVQPSWIWSFCVAWGGRGSSVVWGRPVPTI